MGGRLYGLLARVIVPYENWLFSNSGRAAAADTVMHRSKFALGMSHVGHFDRSGQSCVPVHVGFAPKTDLRPGATVRRHVT